MPTQTELLQKRKELLLKKRQLLQSIGGLSDEEISTTPMQQLTAPVRRQVIDTLGERMTAGIKEKWPQMASGTAMSILGPAAAASAIGPLGTVGGFLVGVGSAFLGGAGGKGWQDFHRMLKGHPKAPKGLLEAYANQGEAAIEEGVAEGAGRILFGVGSKLWAPKVGRVIPGAPQLSRELGEAAQRIPQKELAELPPAIAAQLKKKTFFPRRVKVTGPAAKFKSHIWRRQPRGAILTPGAQTIDPALDWIENAVEGSILGGNRIYDIKMEANPRAFKQFMQELSDGFWKEAGGKISRAEAGELAIDAIQGSQYAFRRQSRLLYKYIDDLTGGQVSIDFRGAKRLAQILHDDAADFAGVGAAEQIEAFTKKILKWPDEVPSFLRGHDFRSALLTEERKLYQVLGSKSPKLSRAIGKLRSSVSQEMKKKAQGHSKELYRAWGVADAFVKHHYKDTSKRAVKSLIRLAEESPELFPDKLFQPHGTSTMKIIKGMVTPEDFNALRAAWFHNQLLKFSDVEGMVVGPRFAKAFESMGDEMLEAMWGKAHLEKIRTALKLGQLTQGPIGRGGGGMVIQLTQAGFIISAIAGVPAGEPLKRGFAPIILGPLGTSRIFTSPLGVKWLTEGFRTPAGTRPAVTLAVRLLKLARGEEPLVRMEQIAERAEKTGKAIRGVAGRHF